MYETKTFKETYGKCLVAWLWKDHRTTNNGRIECGWRRRRRRKEEEEQWKKKLSVQNFQPQRATLVKLQKTYEEEIKEFFFFLCKIEAGDPPAAIHREIPTNWTNHPSDQSVCVCACVCVWVCVITVLHLCTLRGEEMRCSKVGRNACIECHFVVPNSTTKDLGFTFDSSLTFKKVPSTLSFWT